jgi:phosphatidylserine/phosphatidylglycerophosphate/cardiolipin synthase-like enzyme
MIKMLGGILAMAAVIVWGTSDSSEARGRARLFSFSDRIPSAENVSLEPCNVSVYFSPNGGATSALVKEIGGAKKEILVQAYSFTSAPIAKALAEAFGRSLTIDVVLDKSQRHEKYTSATFLANHGITVFIDAKHAIAHNKVMLIDGHTVVTGSFNFTSAAEEKNGENMNIIRCPVGHPYYQAFRASYMTHRGHSELYGR